MTTLSGWCAGPPGARHTQQDCDECARRKVPCTCPLHRDIETEEGE